MKLLLFLKAQRNLFQLMVALCLLCFSSISCDAIYRLLDKEGAEEKDLVGEIVPFEKNPTIEEVQVLLKLYGYNSGKVDGVLGLRTRDAIERFQKDNGLKETRFVDQETWRALKLFREEGFIVEEKLNVLLVQTILKENGFDSGNIDGKFGPKTREKVMELQKTYELKVDGKVGYQTLKRLLELHKGESVLVEEVIPSEM